MVKGVDHRTYSGGNEYFAESRITRSVRRKWRYDELRTNSRQQQLTASGYHQKEQVQNAEVTQEQKVSEEMEEANAEKLVSEISVMGGGEIQESLQKTKETKLFGKILEMIGKEKKNKGEILNRLEVLNERFNEKLKLKNFRDQRMC